jgi:anti-anti-sigma factor
VRVTLASPDDAIAGPVVDDDLDDDLAAELIIETSSDGSTLRLVGEVDVSTRYDLETALRGLADGSGDISLDVSDLIFIDTGGVRLLIELAGRLAPGRRLVLHHTPYELRRVVEMLWRRPPAGLELDG